MPDHEWMDIGSTDVPQQTPLQEIMCGKTRIALTYVNGKFSAISGVCNHVGGPLARAGLRASMSSVPGTTGSFTARQVKARRATTGIRGSDGDRHYARRGEGCQSPIAVSTAWTSFSINALRLAPAHG